MNIRKLEEFDIPQLATLYEQFWNEKSDIAKMEEQFHIIESENNHIILVAEKDSIIMGSVMGIVCKELYGECKPFLVVENMIVDHQYRNTGVGQKLITQLEMLAKQFQCTQMILVTEMDRIDACNFYEKCGFQKNNKGYKKKL